MTTTRKLMAELWERIRELDSGLAGVKQTLGNVQEQVIRETPDESWTRINPDDESTWPKEGAPCLFTIFLNGERYTLFRHAHNSLWGDITAYYLPLHIPELPEE